MTDYRTLLLNSVASDPTRTLTLRSKWVADWNRRIKALKSVVLKAIVEQDVFGLKGQEHFLQVQEDLPVPEPRKFAYRYSQQKVEAFMAWLKEMESRSLLEIIQRPGTLRPEGEPWSNLYVRSAYQRGLEYARTNIASRSAEIAAGMGLKVPLPPSFKSTGAAISALLHQPFHADRLALAYTRVFDELKGVTAAMDQQISRELAKGIMEGLNPRDIGERIGDRIEAIGATRGRLIARTEVINVHAQAALNEYYSAEKTTGEVVLVQWKATHDSRVREKHLDRDMGVYTKEEAYALIGEPNCRCALLPYIPAVQGMPAKATAAARKVCKSAIEDLDEREKKLLEKKAEMVEYELTVFDFRTRISETGSSLRGKVAERLAKKWEVSDEDLLELIKEDRWNSIPDKRGKELRKAFLENQLTHWSGSSGDPISLAAITYISDKLGLTYKLTDRDAAIIKFIRERSALNRVTTSLGELLYSDTQEFLKNKGVTKVRLFRKGAVKNRPFTSWSLYRSDVRRETYGELLERKIEAKYIFSTPRTGYGTLEETEVVILPISGGE